MTTPQAYASSASFLGLAIETTRGTALSPVAYLPIDGPQLTPNVTWLPDKGMRGSPVDSYGNVPGPRHDEYDVKGNVFMDTFPYLLRAILGSADTITAAGSATALSAAATAGASSVTTVATVAVGAMIAIGGFGDTHLVTAVTGTGPYTVTLGQPLINAQSAGATVTPLTAHQIGLLNSATTGHQPPSVTLTEFDGVATRQIAGAIADTLTLTFGADKPTAWSAKFLGNPFTTPSMPTPSFSTEQFAAGYSTELTVNGTQAVSVTNGEIALKRSSAAIQTADGTQAPLVNWAGPLDASGKLTFVVLSGDTTITAGTTYSKQAVDVLLLDQIAGHALNLKLGQVQYDSPKINRGKSYVEVDVNFKAEANSTNALTGYAPLIAVAGNARTTSY